MPRFEAAVSRDNLDFLADRGLLDAGCVNLISLQAVKDRAQDRWPRRQELVWEFTERHLKDRIAPSDLVLRIDDANFLVAVTGSHASAAQAVCLRVLEDVLMHFIGRVDRADLILRRVDAIKDGALTCSAVDIYRIPLRATDPAAEAQALREGAVREKEKNPALFTSLSGKPLQISFATAAVVSLKTGAFAGLHIERSVQDMDGRALSLRELDELTASDLLRIDAATLDYARVYQVDDDTPGYAILIAPVSFRTLSQNRGRQALIGAGGGSKAFQQNVILELLDIQPGTPPGRVAETAAIGRTLARAVLARAHGPASAATAAAEAKLTGFTVRFCDLVAASRSQGVTLHHLCAGLSKISRVLIALGAPSNVDEKTLTKLGFTHQINPSADEKVLQS